AGTCRRRFPPILAAFAAAALLAPFVGAATTVTYPSATTNCTNADTLQNCIDNATADGDTLEIATNSPIAESPTVDHGLTIVPATGFTPEIDGFVFLEGASTSTAFRVSGLAIHGEVRAAPGTGDLDVEISDDVVTVNSSSANAIEVSSGTSPPYGNVTARILRNTVSANGTGGFEACSGIIFGPIEDTGTSSALIQGNRVTTTNCGEGTALLATNGPGETLTADILDNFVSAPGTGDGIELRNFEQTSGSLLIGRIINNVATGQKNIAGFPGGIVVSADGFEPIQAQVINNTVAYNDSGIGVDARTDLGASITGVVANNIVAHNPSYGLSIGTSVSGTVDDRFNLLFANGFNSPPGPGSLAQDPLFVSTSDFHLLDPSPAINHGDTALVPSDITKDLDGHARIQGPAVDMGAYESGVTSVEAIPTLSTGATAALALLIALVAVASLRRPG
ncbi:MAG TPA: choice-of-anchor Q domain-containing protein, partial [Thermoanaerobaculia bacterium]|nr:choice-of-anchor Q domain-containing protein [Thermoanaerobaculia bacterium]